MAENENALAEENRRLKQELAALQARPANLQERRLALALWGGDLAWWDWNVETGDLLYNPLKTGILGYDADEIPPRVEAFIGLIHPEDYERTMETMRQHLRGEKPTYDIRYRLRRKDGGWKWLWDRGKIVERDEEGNPRRLCGVVQDIDDLIRLEKELAAYRAELEQRVAERTAELERTNELLRAEMAERERMQRMLIRTERMSAVSTLAAGVAHEFNNAMTAVVGYMNLLGSSQTLDEKARRRLQIMRQATERVVRTTRNLLAFTRLEPANRVHYDLNVVVDDASMLVRNKLETERIELVRNAGEVPRLLLDPHEMGQVIVHLLINAIHALTDRAEKRITIRTGVEAGRAFLEVRDTGCGIPPADLGRLTLPFFSKKGEHAEQDSSLAKVAGAGLGLSVSERIVQNHEGEMFFESTPGIGTTVTVRLPLSPEERETTAAPVETTPGTAGAVRALVLEDDELVRSFVTECLERAGHEVFATENGATALARIEESRFDMAFVDLLLPAMPGTDFLQQLAQMPPERQPPCVVITGRLDDNAALPGPVSEVLKKPFSSEELLAALERTRALRA